MDSDWKLAAEEARLVEAAGFGAYMKLAASTVIFSLRYLQDFAAKRNLSIHEITPEVIIAEFKAEADKQT